jgi:ABC-type dipeptide/oligopeptide/nickel transport system ATPase component
MNNTVLSALGLVKGYQSGDRRLEILRGLNLSVFPGETVSIRGESGSGKSTLLHLLAGLDSPESGTIVWGDESKSDSVRRSGYLGMVFQAFYLIPELTARENILMAKRIQGGLNATAYARADELLNKVGLSERSHHFPSQLSGGECQRVAVARALMNSPRVIVADEPTGNLDEQTGDGVIQLLLDLCSDMKTSLVLVTHNPIHAARTHTRLLLKQGVLEDI